MQHNTVTLVSTTPFCIQLILYGSGRLFVFSISGIMRSFETIFSQLLLSITKLYVVFNSAVGLEDLASLGLLIMFRSQ